MAFVMLLSGFPIYGYDWESDGIYYEIIGNDDSSCEVVRGDIPYLGEIIIPSNVTFNDKTYSVTSIGTEAFQDCVDLYSISLPETLITIKSNAFGNCGFLHTISIPDNVKSIDRNAFRDTYIEVLYIGKAINNVGTKAFTLVPEIHTTSSLEIIGDEDFEDAESLETLYVSESIQEIEKNAFVFCDALRNVHIESLADWCKIKFGNIEANPLNKTHGFYINGIYQNSLTIPEDVTEISDFAFYNCRSLYELRIPDSVTHIGEKAFYYCSSLSHMYLGNGIRSISDEALNTGYLNNAKRKVYISNLAAFCQIDAGDSVFGYCDLEIIYDNKVLRKIDLTEEDNITYIGTNIFHLYDYLISVSLPNTITSIGEGAFYFCQNLTKVKLSDNLQTIPEECFGLCENLTSVSLPEHLQYLKEDCFVSCLELESISLPASMVELENCFGNCSKLKAIYCYAATPFIASFNYDIMNQATLYVPYGCKKKYVESPYWNGFYNIVEMDIGGIDDITLDSVKEISRYDLQGKPVGEDHRGITFIKYSDGSIEKTFSK